MHKPSKPDDPIQIPLYRAKGAGLVCINLTSGLARAHVNLPKAVTDFSLFGDDASEESSATISVKADRSKSRSWTSGERDSKRAKTGPAEIPRLAMVGATAAIPMAPPPPSAAPAAPPPKVKAEATQGATQDRLRVLIATRGYNYEPVLNRFKRDRDWRDVTSKNAAVNLMESPRVEALQLVTCLYCNNPIEGQRQYDHIGTHPETLHQAACTEPAQRSLCASCQWVHDRARRGLKYMQLTACTPVRASSL